MLAGLSRREICTWYFMPPRSRYAPSVVPCRVSASLLPQALIARAATRAARATIERRIGRGSLPPAGPERRPRQPRNGEPGAGLRGPPAVVGRLPRAESPPGVDCRPGLPLPGLALHPPPGGVPG